MGYEVKVEDAVDESGTRHDYRNMLVITDDKGKRDYWDYGEPEDNSFHRDWDWVADELRNAYEQGKRDGGAQWRRRVTATAMKLCVTYGLGLMMAALTWRERF